MTRAEAQDDRLRNRCGNCMGPYRAHRPRMSAAPLCLKGGTVYREATDEELKRAYQDAFPDGPKPIATFRLDDPADVERARSLLGPEALNRFFGPNGEGAAAFERALADQGEWK